VGVWGTSLYSGDFAMDLRATIGAVVRLPFDADRLIEILCETVPSAANDPGNEEHTQFWLVLADQFAKRGIASERLRDKALRIIEDGQDTAALAKLGMKSGDLRKRVRVLSDLRARIVAAPVIDKPRTVLRKPQPLLMEIGDVMVYPTCGGNCINPYFASKELIKQYTPAGPVPWSQDGWAAMVIIDRGRAFDFLSWYRAVAVAEARREKPSIPSLLGDVRWCLGSPGTCSASHFKKMEIEKIGTLAVDPSLVERVFPGLRPGVSAAVSDISIANAMNAALVSLSFAPTILRIEQILA
jgi:hypothetical protein